MYISRLLSSGFSLTRTRLVYVHWPHMKKTASGRHNSMSPAIRKKVITSCTKGCRPRSPDRCWQPPPGEGELFSVVRAHGIDDSRLFSHVQTHAYQGVRVDDHRSTSTSSSRVLPPIQVQHTTISRNFPKRADLNRADMLF